MTKQQGTCHCGAVKFEVAIELGIVTRCNCSICTKTMWTGAICKPEAFTLLAGEADLGSYTWGHMISTRNFCKHCGVQCFAKGTLEELGGAYVSINVNCLDGVDVHALPVRHWDGRHDNWHAGMRETPWPMFRA